jgi:hypothetical protein
MNPARLALLSICLLAGAAGCSADDDPAVAEAPPSSTSSTTTSTTSTTSTTAPAAPLKRVNALQTPSGNINCGITDGSGFVRCDLLEAEVRYTPPPMPASCEFDWGFSFGIELDGSVELLCVSDAVGDRHDKPAAGTSVRIGRSVCAVEA